MQAEKILELSVILLEVVDAHSPVALPTVRDDLGLAGLHVADSTRITLLDKMVHAVVA